MITQLVQLCQIGGDLRPWVGGIPELVVQLKAGLPAHWHPLGAGLHLRRRGFHPVLTANPSDVKGVLAVSVLQDQAHRLDPIPLTLHGLHLGLRSSGPINGRIELLSRWGELRLRDLPGHIRLKLDLAQFVQAKRCRPIGQPAGERRHLRSTNQAQGQQDPVRQHLVPEVLQVVVLLLGHQWGVVHPEQPQQVHGVAQVCVLIQRSQRRVDHCLPAPAGEVDAPPQILVPLCSNGQVLHPLGLPGLVRQVHQLRHPLQLTDGSAAGQHTQRFTGTFPAQLVAVRISGGVGRVDRPVLERSSQRVVRG